MKSKQLHLRNIFFFALLCFIMPSPAMADDSAPKDEKNAESTPEPADEIVQHIDALANIVAENSDNPELLAQLFSTYLENNRKDMNRSSKSFENRIKRLKADEAEAYRQKLQRKLEPALERLMTLLLQFEDKYPTQARQLDSMLKVDSY